MSKTVFSFVVPSGPLEISFQFLIFDDLLLIWLWPFPFHDFLCPFLKPSLDVQPKISWIKNMSEFPILFSLLSIDSISGLNENFIL